MKMNRLMMTQTERIRGKKWLLIYIFVCFHFFSLAIPSQIIFLKELTDTTHLLPCCHLICMCLMHSFGNAFDCYSTSSPPFTSYQLQLSWVTEYNLCVLYSVLERLYGFFFSVLLEILPTTRNTLDLPGNLEEIGEWSLCTKILCYC